MLRALGPRGLGFFEIGLKKWGLGLRRAVGLGAWGVIRELRA